MVKKILKDIFSQKGIILVIFLGIITQLCFMIFPYLGKYFVNFIEAGEMGFEFWLLFRFSFLILIIFFIVSSSENYLLSGLLGRYEMEKTKYYHKKFLDLDYDVRINQGTGKTITKISRGISSQVRLFDMFYQFISVFFVRLFLIGGIFLNLYPPIIFALIIFAILLMIFNKIVSKKIRVLTDTEQDKMEEIGRQTSKIIMESSLIKVLSKEKQELGKLNDLTSLVPKIRQKIFLLNGIIYNILDVLIRGAEIVLYGVLGILVINASMSIGELTMSVAYMIGLWWPIAMFVNNVVEMRTHVSKIEALENLVNQENKIKDGKKKFVLGKGKIIFDNITFSYDERRKIFENFSLEIEGGKTTALVGHSGSGKSTLIKLILRNYLVDSGKINIDGQDINSLKISSFYDNLGYLSQEPAVFDGTIRDNLQYASNKKIKDEDLYSVLKKVDLFNLINKLDKKLDTEIGEKGLKLSGGEKQRIAIARIFLRNPKILILDEPTSALDSISEQKITKILNNVMKGRTVIVIAHRLQTVMDADRIIVFEEGKIIETGTHDELIKQKGKYSKLVDLQRGVIIEE